MAYGKLKRVTEIDPATGADIPVRGLYSQECGSFSVTIGAITKIFPDVEYVADFTADKERFRRTLCKASDYSKEIKFNRASGQWENPAFITAKNMLDEYREKAKTKSAPVRRDAEIALERQNIAAKNEALKQRAAIGEQKSRTVGDLIDEYDVSINGSLKSYATSKSHLQRIKADFGSFTLRDLSLKQIEIWAAQLKLIPRASRKKVVPGKKKPSTALPPVSAVTVNRYLQTFKAMMTKACDWNMITGRKLRELRKIELVDERHNKRTDFLSHAEAERLIQAADAVIRPLVTTALQTGMRKGEILGLKWKQIDMTHGLIHLPETKSGDTRSIRINERLDATLRGMVRGIDDNSYVFTNPETKTRWSDLKSLFNRAVVKAKLSERKIVFHSLRHTTASWLVMAGVPLLTVAQILGHSDIKMVMRYSHLSPGHLDTAMSMLEPKTSNAGHSGAQQTG